jgi:hypothetical protein
MFPNKANIRVLALRVPRTLSWNTPDQSNTRACLIWLRSCLYDYARSIVMALVATTFPAHYRHRLVDLGTGKTMGDVSLVRIIRGPPAEEY